MGYTHYWYQDEKLDADLFDKASKDCQKVCHHGDDVHIQLEYDQPNLPIFSENQIRFNGVGEDGHETFSISKDSESRASNDRGQQFDFCKTAYKPYDKYVTACLVILKHHLGDAISVSSDGDLGDWTDGIALVEKVLDYGKDFKFDSDD